MLQPVACGRRASGGSAGSALPCGRRGLIGGCLQHGSTTAMDCHRVNPTLDQGVGPRPRQLEQQGPISVVFDKKSAYQLVWWRSRENPIPRWSESRIERRAPGAGDGQRADAALAHEAGRGRRAGDQRRHMAGHQIVHRRPAAAERNVIELRAAARFQQLAGEMAGPRHPTWRSSCHSATWRERGTRQEIFASFEIRVGWHYVHTLGVLPGRGAIMFQLAV